ncbi:MAG TPA: hypothetical protein PK771_09770 [Spirochaetota bacterium]|nr:hypothetical protein [Spirochaetota bacterium]
MSNNDIKNFYFGLDYYDTIKANSYTDYKNYSINKYRIKGGFLTETSTNILFSTTDTTTTTSSTTSTTVSSSATTTTINNTSTVTGNEFDTYITIETAEKYTLTIDKSKIELVKEK